MKNQSQAPQSQTKHTPTPWQWFDDGYEGIMVYDKTGKKYICSQLTEDNASYIVKAVNCHEELVEALSLLLQGVETGELISIEDGMSKAKQVLAKAGE